MQRDTQMQFIQKMYLYDLYIKNQDTFHTWLFVKKSKILGSVWTPIIGVILAVILAITAFNMIQNRTEIDEYDYRRISGNVKAYNDEVPEYKVRLKFHLSDGEINEMEYSDLRSLLTDWHEWKDQQDFLEEKRKALAAAE